MTNIQCSRTVILSNKFIVKLSAIYRLTQVVLEKRPLNGCSSRSSYQQYRLHQILFMQKPVPLIPRTITEQVFGFLISWLLNISCTAICFFSHCCHCLVKHLAPFGLLMANDQVIMATLYAFYRYYIFVRVLCALDYDAVWCVHWQGSVWMDVVSVPQHLPVSSHRGWAYNAVSRRRHLQGCSHSWPCE